MRFDFHRHSPRSLVGNPSWIPRQWLRGMTLVILALLTSPSSAAKVEVRDGRFYVDSEPFYVRGVGYMVPKIA